jgi:hypothetical protein
MAFTAIQAARVAMWVDFKLYAVATNSQIAWVWHPFHSQASAPGPESIGPTTWSILNQAHTSVGMNTSTEDNGVGALTLVVTIQWQSASTALSIRAFGVKTIVE